MDEDPDHTSHGLDCYEVDNNRVDEKPASNGKISFNTLEFDEPETYIYKVFELNEGEAYVTYDETQYNVWIEVFINDANEMQANVTLLQGGTPVTAMEFWNTKETPPKPTEPEKPTEPGGSDDSEDPEDPANTRPLTGDDTNLPLWLGLMGIFTIAVIVTLIVFDVRKSKREYED